MAAISYNTSTIQLHILFSYVATKNAMKAIKALLRARVGVAVSYSTGENFVGVMCLSQPLHK